MRRVRYVRILLHTPMKKLFRRVLRFVKLMFKAFGEDNTFQLGA